MTPAGTLFQSGDFTLSSGARSKWKVECDALTPGDWDTLALMAMERFKLRFSVVMGVPRGGESLAEAMKPYAVKDSKILLICEDVGTTFASMERVKREYGYYAIGLVAFARTKPPVWVDAIWRFGP